MDVKVGIPRALFYYRYYPLWKTFFEELNTQVVLSDDTTSKILDEGTKACVAEACLPVKIFYGHVMNIKDKVDYLFVPRFTSISKKEYICPKFGGLPDMIRNSIKNLPPLIDTEINLRKSKKNAIKAAMEIGSFFTEDKRKIKNAYKKALKSFGEFDEKIKKGMLATDILDRKFNVIKKSNEPLLNILVIGHVYNLYDSFINMDMIEKLRKKGAQITTIDMVEEDIIRKNACTLPKRMFWNFGSRAFGSTMHFLEREDIDGIIYLMSFGCGIDSFVCDLIERKIRKTKDIPFIILTLDEHSGQAGMDTRLEAFIDMIRWRYRNEDNVSAYG
ncbi:MAG TPA: acyl-CoA dehydratase activase-related protein [Acetivibrio sp.]|uniref:acyl-CoA dehydratase activase-related protein n=1 Tax=Acetivibrio sp. TaxID=1872092 RepID=UPI002C6B3954|nr:acyl-CoA dehydratase activase-related protein [Acetivibrio sp.]HOM02203.1 acyl-CoA dehydratase activase-related protein [Acetivibrio sp.]